jgi:hypothetical protein
VLTRRSIAAAMLLTTSVGACTTWGHKADVLTQPVPERQPLELWTGSQRHWLHGMVVRGDTIRAVPRWKPPGCDSCAILLALADVDSVRVRVASPVRTVALVTSLAAFVYIGSRAGGVGGPGS